MEERDVADTPPSHQLKALMYKNATLQTRQRKTLCCQLFIPILLVTLVGVLQLEIDKLVAGFSPNEPGTLKLFNASYVPFDGTGRFLWSWNCWYSTDNPSIDDAVGYLNVDGTHAGMLGQITQFQVPGAKPLTVVTRPVFSTFFNSSESMYSSLTALKEYDITQKVLGNKTNAGICPDCPVASFNFVNLTETAELVAINYTVLVDTQGNIFFNSNRTTAVNMINTAFLRDVYQNVYLPTIDPIANPDAFNIVPNIEFWDRPMPYVTQPYVTDAASFFAIFMLPMCFSFLLPVFLYGIVVEKQDKLRAMMLMMGLQMRWYWLVTCLYNFLLYALIVLIVTIISLMFQLRIFTQTSPIFLFLSLFLWGLAMVALSVLVSAFFSSARTATIVGYLLVIASVIVSNTINITTNYEATPNGIFLLYAPYAFFRIIFVLGLYCGVGQCPTPGFNDSQLAACWGYLILDTIIYFVVGLYLDAVFPQQWGVRRHPLFPYYALKNWLFPADGRKDEAVALLGNQMVPLSEDRMEEVDDVVIKESALVTRTLNREISKDDPNYERMSSAYSSGLLVDKLRKVYPSGKVAVETISLAVPKGECFGLLGPNGAGKTTTISMLTGLFSPTDGRARVGGYDLETELFKVHRVMGVCPQFDILWENLSCLETILFYTRLKGVPASEEKRHADDALRSVGLYEFKDRMIEDLSGGMKRRVSLAVSLCGFARVVFLDEPTTGLDPVTRRQLWDVLLQLKQQNRSLVLTTHSMEEADVLCDRIGIMTLGELRCLGTALQLKNKYGSGYIFTIQFDSSREENAKAFIESTFPSAQHRDHFPGHAVYTLMKDTFKISELFHIMASNASRYGIVDWGLTQTTLEDVFLNVADEDLAVEDD